MSYLITDKTKLQIDDVLAKDVPGMTVFVHGLHTGYIAEAILKTGRAKLLLQRFADMYDMTEDELTNSVAFLCASHDVGKAHPDFIAKMYGASGNESIIELYERLQSDGLLPNAVNTTFRHERYSKQIVKRYLNDKGFDSSCQRYADILAYHHQGKDERNFQTVISEPTTDWLNVQDEIEDRYFAIWPFSKKCGSASKRINAFSYLILQVMILSDWIASSEFWQAELNDTTMSAYREHANHFLKAHELQFFQIQKRCDVKWEDIFDFAPNALQSAIIEVAKTNPLLTIIEYPCGGGKTEGGLAGAYVMGKNRSGIYMCTPTIATAQGLLARIRQMADKAGLGINIPELDGSSIWSDNEMDRIDPTLWPSRSRHHLLYPFAVGTVDQVLKSVCASRYVGISLLGIADKVLIIDEVHAYQAFTRQELEHLLKWCRAYGIPVILMSATLPTKLKKRFLECSGYFGDMPNDSFYPMITSFSEKDGLQCRHVPCSGKTIGVSVKTVGSISDEMFDAAMSLQEGCMALIERTVDDAWVLYDRIKASVSEDVEVVLFHGRDTLAHKKQKTEMLLKKLGKDRRYRPRKIIVVSTSILEQSLDVDFDYMLSALAPIDLLIQRMGRVWRHADKGTVREHAVIESPVTILIPEQPGVLTKLYDDAVLSETAHTLQGLRSFDTVKDVRRLVDSVYDKVTPKKETVSAIAAGRYIIDSPFKDTMTITGPSATQYAQLSHEEARTREESYPSVQIAIVTEEQFRNNTFEMARYIHQHCVGTVAQYKTEALAIEPKSMPMLNGVKVYVGKNGVVSDGIQCMILEENGLKFTNL